VRVDPIDDVERFASLAGDFLATDEANHTVLLSALQGARRTRERGEPLPDGWFGAIAYADDRVAAVARRWRDVWLTSTGPDAALQALGRWAVARGPFRGIVGQELAVAAFERGCGLAFRTHTELPLMRLEGSSLQPAPCAGALRQATLDDLALLREWNEAFRVEARIEQTVEQVARDTERKARDGAQYLWIDPAGEPQGLVGGTLIAPSGARIGPVYTPPARRGRGIGGAMVTALAQRFLDAGARCVFLFTDASNPVSNALYRRVGFVPIGRHLHRVQDGPPAP
jgi:ribosomal protein S18 acetylase RimI-like enzyme